MKELILYVAADGKTFPSKDDCVLYEQNEMDLNLPYIYSTKIDNERSYNPEYKDENGCQCGHAYYRHFDSYEDNYPCGCKYCACSHFVDAKIFSKLLSKKS